MQPRVRCDARAGWSHPRRMNVIEVNHLTKRYGDRAAVDGVSFSVEEGEIFGILGPNGAGKTTTVETIAGLRSPDGGTISVLGLDPRRDRERLRSLVGVQLQESELPERMTVGEALELFASFYEEPADPRTLIADLGLDDKRDTAYRHLSGGQKQRLSIALALVGPAQDRDPGRALDRTRPAGSPRDVAAHRVDARPRRDGPPGHPPDGGGRAARRSRRRLRRGPADRPRHAGRHRLDGGPGAAAPVPTIRADRRPAAHRPARRSSSVERAGPVVVVDRHRQPRSRPSRRSWHGTGS